MKMRLRRHMRHYSNTTNRMGDESQRGEDGLFAKVSKVRRRVGYPCGWMGNFLRSSFTAPSVAPLSLVDSPSH